LISGKFVVDDVDGAVGVTGDGLSSLADFHIGESPNLLRIQFLVASAVCPVKAAKYRMRIGYGEYT
jgi:hypothetical protein